MRHRLAIILPVYTALFSFSLLMTLLMRYEFRFNATHWGMFFMAVPFFLGVKLSNCALLCEWNRTFRHASIMDTVFTAGSCVLSAAMLLAATYLIPHAQQIMPRSIIAIDCLLSILLLYSFRIGCRLLWKHWQRKKEVAECESALIFGNDETAIGIWKMLSVSNGRLGRYHVVGFIDPGPQCQRSLIGGQQVYPLQQLWQHVVENSIQQILVPTTTPGRVLRDLLHQCKRMKVNVHKIPTVEEIVEGRFRLAVRELDIDDLLRRPPTQLDQAGIGELIAGKTVLVTGGAGSIGSELCRQILDFKPGRLIVFDHSEFGIFQIEREFAQASTRLPEITYITASVLDQDALESVFECHKPELVFHAAAYKHVPLMQDNPCAAIRNNILGTKAVVDAAHRHHAERFVLISTDKAVRPTSVMGATKLMAEKYLQGMAQVSSTKFITVRFGNVLNSVGSVVPTFRKQIEQGGPVTVTHPDMIRYFMTIPEAVQLVLQAGAAGQSGNVLILDMGDPVKIMDLAQDMITLSGLSYPEDIDIEFSGLRPGEKMYEELFYEHEQGAEKVHEKIFLGSGYAPSMMELNTDLKNLNVALKTNSSHAADVLWQVVDHYVTIDDQKTTPQPLVAAA